MPRQHGLDRCAGSWIGCRWRTKPSSSRARSIRDFHCRRAPDGAPGAVLVAGSRTGCARLPSRRTWSCRRRPARRSAMPARSLQGHGSDARSHPTQDAVEGRGVFAGSRSTIDAATASAAFRSPSVSRTANSSPPSRATRSLRAETGAEEPSRGDDQLVPGSVAQGVVDALEVVEVEQQQRTGRPVATTAIEVSLELALEPSAIGQSGECVVVGQMPQAASRSAFAPKRRRR